ncbi:6559_t:CDS:2 [Entrophospora sp. SA101]|nr:6559_t:CDS:2 [Entrophospora sp. SA101]
MNRNLIDNNSIVVNDVDNSDVNSNYSSSSISSSMYNNINNNLNISDNKSIGRPGSSVWNHFTKGEGKSKGKHTATCLFCNKYYPRGTPNELESHLVTTCIQVPSSLKEHYLRVISNKDCDSSDKKRKIESNQRKLTQYHKYLNHDKIRELMLFAIELWADMGHGKQTSTRLVSQIHLYREKKPPYDLPYDNAISSYTWWNLLSKSGAEKLLENEDNEEIEIGNDENNEEIEVDDVESNEDAAINNQTRLLIEDYINIDINLFNSEINSSVNQFIDEQEIIDDDLDFDPSSILDI